jgi:hypothetical protein
MMFPVFVNLVIFVKLVFPAKTDARVVKMEPTLIQPLKGVINVRMVITETQLLGLANLVTLHAQNAMDLLSQTVLNVMRTFILLLLSISVHHLVQLVL